MRAISGQQQMSAKRRSVVGFTLLELLIVIGLIGLLISIAGVVVGNIIQQARENATRTTLLKIDGLLTQRLEALRTLLEKPQKQAELQATAKRQLAQVNLSSASFTEFGKLLARKYYFRTAFPQTLIPALSDNPTLTVASGPFAGNAQNEAESAELLYWALTTSDTFGSSPVDDSEFSTSELGDTDGDGRREFVDSWGNPLRFYRWPTRLVRPGGIANPPLRSLAELLISGLPSQASQGDAEVLVRDPDDLQDVYEAIVLQGGSGSGVMNAAAFEGVFHTPLTYHIPLIVSEGPDRQLGLYEPFDLPNYGRLAQPRPANQFDDGSANTAAANATDWGNSTLNDNLTNRQKQK